MWSFSYHGALAVALPTAADELPTGLAIWFSAWRYRLRAGEWPDTLVWVRGCNRTLRWPDVWKSLPGDVEVLGCLVPDLPGRGRDLTSAARSCAPGPRHLPCWPAPPRPRFPQA